MAECDIIIPVWNQFEVTKNCLESLIRHTKCKYTLVLIDNGSDEKVRKFLEVFKNSSSGNDVMLLRNEKNVGFIKAVNQGLRQSHADYVCVLNNDTIVTYGWLTEMIKVYRSNPEIGIVNPSSNNLGQKIPFGKPIKEYADGICRGQSGKYIELMNCLGFCMLIKRSLIDRIGYFDEIFGMGNFEDTDFCMRAKKEGFTSVRALGAYVYHKENTSFKIFTQYHSEFEKNKKIYESRWGVPKRVLFAIESDYTENKRELTSKIIKEVKCGNWVFASIKNKGLIDELKTYSNLSVHESFHAFKIFMRILVKKKKFDIIYTDSRMLAGLGRKFGFVRKADWILL